MNTRTQLKQTFDIWQAEHQQNLDLSNLNSNRALHLSSWWDEKAPILFTMLDLTIDGTPDDPFAQQIGHGEIEDGTQFYALLSWLQGAENQLPDSCKQWLDQRIKIPALTS